MAEEGNMISFGDKALSEARDIVNFRPTNRGGQTREQVPILFKDSGTNSPITSLYSWTRKNGNNYFMVSQGANLMTMNTSTGALSTIHSSLTNGAFIHYEPAYDDLIICDGTNGPKKYDGSTVSNLGGSPPSKARQSRFYLDSLFIYPADSSIVYYSDVGNIEAGYASNLVRCDNDDGSTITNLSRFYLPQQLVSALVVGKTNTVGAIFGAGTAGDPFSYRTINQDQGMVGFRCATQHDQDISYLTPRGVMSYRTAVTDINLDYKYLTKKVEDQFLALNKAQLEDSISVYDWARSRVMFWVPEANSDYPNVSWNYDVVSGGWYKTKWGLNVTAAFVDPESGDLWLGSDDGKIYKYDGTNNTAPSGLSVASSYKTPYLEFGVPHIRKRLIDCRMKLKSNGSYGLGVAFNNDYGALAGTSHNVITDRAVYTWGGGTWTSDPNTYRWGGPPITLKRFFPGEYFYSTQMEITNPFDGQPIDIISIEFEVEYMEHD